MRANRLNIAMWWLFFNHVTQLDIALRQVGKSISSDAVMVYLLTIGAIKTDMHLLTKDDSLRVKNVQRVKDLISGLPYYLNLKMKGDTNNTEKVTINRLGNQYLTSVAQASPKAALNLGRGMTIAVNQIDEIAFIKNNDITIPALLAGASAARDMAKEANAPYGNIFTTTPGYLSSKEGRFAYKLYQDSLRWTEKLLDCNDEEDLVRVIKKNNSSGKAQVLVEFNHRQLGYTDDWLKIQIEAAMAEGETVEAEFLNIWAEGTVTSPLSKETLAKIKNSLVKDPYVIVSKNGYILRWYIPQDEVIDGLSNRAVTISLDTSDAVGNDDIALEMMDDRTGETIATGTYNETNLITFSEWLVELLSDYLTATMIIERRSSGVAILDNLLRILPNLGMDPFKRLFNWVVNDYKVKPIYKTEVIDVPLNRRSTDVYTKYRKYFGYATSGGGRSSRDNLYGEALSSATKYIGHLVRDRVLIDQLSGLTIRNGRIDHASGNHDDLVISYLLAYWFLTKADNLDYYGINTNKVLSTVTSAVIEEQGGEEAIILKEEQLALKETIDNLLEELNTTKDNIRTKLLTNRIKHLYKQIDTTIIPNFSIESVLTNIEMNKQKSKSASNYMARYNYA